LTRLVRLRIFRKSLVGAYLRLNQRDDFLKYTVDCNPYKHGKYLPGTHIPICPRERIFETKRDYVLTLPWNLNDEIVSQVDSIRSWGARFVVPIPEVSVI
jgi:hypothetical protein